MLRFFFTTSSLNLSTSANSIFSDCMKEKKVSLGHSRVNFLTRDTETMHPLYRLIERILASLLDANTRFQAWSWFILELMFNRLNFEILWALISMIGIILFDQPFPPICKTKNDKFKKISVIDSAICQLIYLYLYLELPWSSPKSRLFKIDTIDIIDDSGSGPNSLIWLGNMKKWT